MLDGMNIGALSYSLAAILYLAFAGFLIIRWQGRLQGAIILLATLATVVWAAFAGYAATTSNNQVYMFVLLLECMRDLLWLTFLLQLLGAADNDNDFNIKYRTIIIGMFALVFFQSFVLLYYVLWGGIVSEWLWVHFLVFVLLAIAGLVLVENLFRAARNERLWAIKYLCFGLGGLFAFDFLLYTDALLFRQVDQEFWSARGVISALIVPCFFVAAFRNPEWSFKVFVSRRVIFHGTALLGTAGYLVVMVVGGYYVRDYGGDWGRVAQVVFLFCAMLFFLFLIFSKHLRAHLKVLYGKHLFSHKYDYREEWLRFNRNLSMGREKGLRERAIKAMVDSVMCRGGVLWMRRASKRGYSPVTVWKAGTDYTLKEPNDSALITFLRDKQWVVNLKEYRDNHSLYADLVLPSWLKKTQSAWLVVPLIQHSDLLGFVVLEGAQTDSDFNWEDIDLLRVAGREVASYLALDDVNRALIDARQFEAFNQLSAFVMHDLKNVIAQLSLVVSNAGKHKGNPAFVDDAIQTVDHSVAKMNKLLTQLKSGHGQAKDSLSEKVSLSDLLVKVVALRRVSKPAPKLHCHKSANVFAVQADSDRLAAVFEHLVQNAQEATPETGSIEIRLKQKDGMALIEIEDNGTGMDALFVRDRLFRPFDSTKGDVGMGIGVYESRVYIQELGGEVDVVSTLGSGTLFSIHLPVSIQ